VDGSHALLVALLVLNGLQAAVAVAAAVQGHRRRRAGARHLARYSFGHALLLVAGALALSVVPLLGLADVLATQTAAVIAVAVEVVGVVAGSALLQALHATAHGSPGSAASPAAAASAATPERASEPPDA